MPGLQAGARASCWRLQEAPAPSPSMRPCCRQEQIVPQKQLSCTGTTAVSVAPSIVPDTLTSDSGLEAADSSVDTQLRDMASPPSSRRAGSMVHAQFPVTVHTFTWARARC